MAFDFDNDGLPVQSTGGGFDFDEDGAPAREKAGPEEGGFTASAKQAVGATIKGAGQLAADFIPGIDKDNAVARYGQEVIDANPTAVRSLEDIKDKPWTAVKEGTGNAASSVAQVVGARAVGMGITAASPLAGPAAPVVAMIGQAVSWLGPAAVAALPSYGSIREKQILKDPALNDDMRSKAVAALGAATVGAIETKFGPQEWALSALTKEGRKAMAEKFAETTLAKAVGFGAAKGAVVEGGEELVQNPVEQLASYDDPTTPESLRETAFGGAMGAIGGGVLGGGTGAVVGRSQSTTQKQPDIEDITSAPNVDAAIAAADAVLAAPLDSVQGAGLAPANQLMDAARGREAAEVDLNALIESETRNLQVMAAQLEQETRKQTDLDQLQQTSRQDLGRLPDQQVAAAEAATDETPTAMQLAMQRALARQAEKPDVSATPAIQPLPAAPAVRGRADAAPGLAPDVGTGVPDLRAVEPRRAADQPTRAALPLRPAGDDQTLTKPTGTPQNVQVETPFTAAKATPAPAEPVPVPKPRGATTDLEAVGVAQKDGTALIRGDVQKILAELKRQGFTAMLKRQGGVLVGRSQAQRALEVFKAPAVTEQIAPEQSAAPAPSARQVAVEAERARMEAKRVQRSAAAKEAAKPMEGLSVGSMPTNAEPVSVKDGVVHIGKYAAQNFDTGADVTVPAGATPQQIVAALKESGALGKRAKFFGLPQETQAPQPVQREASLPPAAQQRADFAAAEKVRTAPGNRARARAHDANPFKAFIAKHGINVTLANEFAPGLKERQAALVQGYGPVFRRSGMQLDALAELAVQDGYLTAPDVTRLSAMITDALRGKRIIPQYAEGVAETEMQARDALEKEAGEEQNAEVEAETKVEREAIQALAELSDESLQALATDDAVLTAGNNVSEADFLRALGATEQEIKDATQGQGRKGQDAESRPGPQEAAAGAAPRGAESRDGQARADDKGLTAPTRADIVAQQDRTEAAPARDQREQVRKESEAGAGLFELTAQDGRQDTTGSLFDQPAEPAVERFEIGKSLTKEQRRQVLSTLIDVYKAKGAPREQKGVGRDGNERSGYVYSPDLFEKSDITGAMVRYYVTLPDKRIAHPSELFPDYTQSDIDAEIQRRESAERADADEQNRAEERADKFAQPTIAEAEESWRARNQGPNSLQDWRTGKKHTLVPMEKDGRFYSVRSDDAALMARLERAGWKNTEAPNTTPAAEKPISQMSAADLLRAAADKMEGKAETIQDLGEKIGGARKDTAQPTGRAPRKSAETDDRPAWARRFQISEIVRAGGQIGEVRNEGRWVIRDTRSLDWMKQPKQVGRETFVSKEAAEKALPLLAVAQKHRVVPATGPNGTQAWEIWRDINDRKRVKVVDLQFGSRDDAMRYMAEHATEIIEANTTFGEADLPVPEDKQRIGADRRQGDVKGEDFRSAFGFRGVEFGNWNNQDERQQLMNEAYDGLMDLAEVMGIPPKAISLNGDLALAFGARGHGLSGARAHYEPDRAVMNLTKMKGAGALAHEWFHALDHYFGRQDGKAPVEWVTNKDGTRSLKVNGDFENNAVSSGFRRSGSGVREEVRTAISNVMTTMAKKAEQYVEDTAKTERFVAAVRNDVDQQLTSIRRDLAEQKDVRYWKRNNKPAGAEQLAEFDAIAQRILAGEALDTQLRPSGTKTLTGMRWSNDALEQISTIYKAVRGRSGFDSTDQSGILDRLRQRMGLYSARLKMLAEAQTGAEKTKQVPTDFAMDAKSLDQGRGTDYWTTPHEMAARAFQGYVEDKIAERGGKSPFLNYGPENAGILTPWGAKRPYPAGEERKAINAAFDKLVDVIETRETEQGVAMFSRADQNNTLPVDDASEELVQESGEPVASITDAERRMAAGERIFAMHEQSDTLSEITSVRQLKNWTSDQLIALPPGASFSQGQLPAVITPSTVARVQSAITELLGGKQLPNSLGRIVATTAAEIKTTWEPLIGKNVQIGSEGEAGIAQAFFDPRTKTVFLIADHINEGTETAVLAHELMHKHGQAVLGEAGWDRLHSLIGTWKDAPEDSDERFVYDYASRKVEAVGKELSTQELFPYAVEAAIKIGVKPSMQASRGTAARWLESVRQNIKMVWGRITGKPETFKAQDLVDLAFGIAQMENPESAQALRGTLDETQAEQNALRALSENDELFALPKSDKTTVEEIAAENDPDIKVRQTKIGGETLYTLTMPGGETAKLWVRPPNKYGEEQLYSMELVDGERTNEETGRPGENPEDVDPATEDVYLDVSNLKPGQSGNTAYNIAATFAHNTGRIFIGDPSGLSDIAMRRRTEHMLSSALKFGTTRHLAPHPRQTKGDAKIGVPPMRWTYGDDLGNIQELIRVSNQSLDHAGANLFAFDLQAGAFRDPEGGVIDDSAIRSIVESGRRPESRAGITTLKRNAVLSALVREEGGQGGSRGTGAAILARLVDVGRQHAASTQGIFYSRRVIVGETTRKHTPEQLRAMRNVGFEIEVPTLKERAQALWQDAGKKLAQGIVDQFAPVKDLDKEAYGLLRLAKGASGAFEVFLHGGKLKLTDGVYDFDDQNKGGVIERLLLPLKGEHHDFFRWIAANRAERLTAEGRENLFTAQDIADLKTLADGTTDFDYTVQTGPRAGTVTRDRTLIYADAQRVFNEFNRNVLDLAEQSGLIDGASRHLWENEFYVPFYRVADEDGGVRGANIKSGVVRQEAFKKLKGGTQELNADLLDNTLMNWAHLLDAAAKNRAAKATIEAAEKLGAATQVPDGTKKSVWFMDGGQKHHAVVDDPYLLTAITSLEYAGMRNPVMNAMGAFKHALTIGVTASPFFKVRNLIRDSMQVLATSGINPNPVANVGKGWALTDPKSDAYMRLMAGGGTIHFGTMLEGSEAKRVQALVESGVDDATILDSDKKVKAFYRRFIEPGITAYNELGNRGEAINRASLYDQLRKQGISHAEASLQARDLMDFSMQGSFTTIRFLTQVVPFFNARLQGMYKLGRAAKEDPKRMATVIGAVTLMSLALLAAYGDDDDWKKREEWDRNNYWWFKFGGTAFRIPKPFEIGAMATLAERGFELMFDKEMTGKRFRKQVLTLLGDNLSMNPIPQLVKPVLDVYANKDSFTGRPIETMGMDRLEAEYRFTNRTSMLARGASTAANAVTGLAGIESPSPVQIDHMLRGYFGWLGAFVVGSADTMLRPMTGQPERASPDLWKVATGGMVGDVDSASSRYVSQMYEQAKEIERAYATWRNLVKEGKTLEAGEYLQEHRDDIRKHRGVSAVKAQESRLNQRIRMIERSSMDADKKRDQIKRLQEQKDSIARRLTQ